MKKINVVVAVVLMVLGLFSVDSTQKVEAAKVDSPVTDVVYADVNGGVDEFNFPSYKSYYTVEEAGLFKVVKTEKHEGIRWYQLSNGKWIQAQSATKVKKVNQKKISKKALKKAKTYDLRIGDVTYFYKLVMHGNGLGICFVAAIC